MTKKRKSKKRLKKSSGFWTRYKKLLFLTILLILTIFFIYGSFDTIKSLFEEKKREKKLSPNKELLKKMDRMLKEERKKVDILKKELEKAKKTTKKIKATPKLQNRKKIVSSEALDYKKSLQKYQSIKTVKEKTNIVVKSNKPLLAIIIDDVAFLNEVKKIKALPFKVTPSFFPPTKRHPNTPKFAKEFDFYMVHLPLEALHYPHPEPQTLMIGDTQSTIDRRIKEIKKWFPKDKFINNHTGSYFSSNYQAMVKLFKALDKNNLIFVDSRTSAKTVALSVAKKFHKKLLSRDIFIDNVADISYIKNQLKKAVKRAKKRGYALAIGHPHPKTLEALKESRGLFDGVKLVYVKTIYENSKTYTK